MSISFTTTKRNKVYGRQHTGAGVVRDHQLLFRRRSLLEEERVLAPSARASAADPFLITPLLINSVVPSLQASPAADAVEPEWINEDVEQPLKAVLEGGDGRADRAHARLDERQCEDPSCCPGDVVRLEEDVVELDGPHDAACTGAGLCLPSDVITYCPGGVITYNRPNPKTTQRASLERFDIRRSQKSAMGSTQAIRS